MESIKMLTKGNVKTVVKTNAKIAQQILPDVLNAKMGTMFMKTNVNKIVLLVIVFYVEVIKLLVIIVRRTLLNSKAGVLL